MNLILRASFAACLVLLLIIVMTLNRPRAVAFAGAASLVAQTALQPNTLCAKDERVIFGCLLRRPAKIVSVCASKDLTRETGYIQYRFGLPRKVELEFPKTRQSTQTQFKYTHYFRARFELNDINFTVDGVNYSVFDDYNGEEKVEVSLQGVSINKPSTGEKEVRYNCRTKPKTDYTDLQAVLEGQ